jgi:LmeA-like phospholipid-binding
LNALITDNSPAKKPSHLIGKILSPAIELWLKSQVQQVAKLKVQIEGKSRQILTGNIPCVSIIASQAVYQGLHVAEIHLVATGIAINLGQVIKGQPLKLLEKVPVTGKLQLQQADINASLRSPLLSDALTELLSKLAPQFAEQPVCWDKVTLDDGQMSLNATINPDSKSPQPIVVQAGLRLCTSQELEILQPKVETSQGESLVSLDSFKVDLGKEVDLEELALHSGKVICIGKINVIP